MKSFKQYILEEKEDLELPTYRVSGKQHLSSIPVFDSKGNVHQATFHSELKSGQIRYDFTEAARAANANRGFLKIGGMKVGEKELEHHHLRSFTGDVFSASGGRGLGHKGIMLMTYTPEGREDKEPPVDPTEPRLKKARRLGPPIPGGRRSTVRPKSRNMAKR